MRQLSTADYQLLTAEADGEMTEDEKALARLQALRMQEQKAKKKVKGRQRQHGLPSVSLSLSHKKSVSQKNLYKPTLKNGTISSSDLRRRVKQNSN